MFKVGTPKDPQSKARERTFWTYGDVHTDIGGWADAKRFLPADCDLCDLKIKGVDKSKPGWHCGHQWDGLNLQPGDVVLYWRKQ